MELYLHQVHRYFWIASFLFSILLTQEVKAQSSVRTNTDDWVKTRRDSLHIKTFRSASLTNQPNLVVIIHGDAPFNNPGYQYELARLIAEKNTNTIAIGLLRPGYTDPQKNHSPGGKGLTTGDNYTPEVIDDISTAINNLKNLYHPSNIVIAGHSGGSAITADIVGRYSGIANAAVIVSSPCYLDAWRAHMKALQKNNIWGKPVTSLSPDKLVNGIDKKTKVTVVSGEKDDVAPTQLSIDYYELLKKNNIDAKLITVKDAGHEIFLTDEVQHAIAELIK